MLEEEPDLFASAIDTTEDAFAEVNINEASAPPVDSGDNNTTPVTQTTPPSKPAQQKSTSVSVKPIKITVTNPEKIGDGMGAYVVYSVNTSTTLPNFRKPEMTVKRRFSDFLGLHGKLVDKHQSAGRIIPPAPEKSVLGMTKVKISKEEVNSVEFLERRRAALERFLNRIAQRECLSMDPDFREFLEYEGDLPKATNTQAFSGAGVLRLFKNVGEAVNKFTYRMDENDLWFEEKQIDVDNLERQLSRLHFSFESLVNHRQELAQNTQAFVRSCSLMASAEEHTGLARALTKLAETEENIEHIQSQQAQTDFYTIVEMLKDTIAMMTAIKDLFHERVKLHKLWKDAEVNLSKKREQKVKLELGGKNDKAAAMEKDIREGEERVEKYKKDFELMSQTLKSEIEDFDLQRINEFKQAFVKSLEEMISNQEKIIHQWEAYLPEAKAAVL